MERGKATPKSQGRLFTAELSEPNRDELRIAWHKSGIRQPFETALANPALALCLRNTALAMKRRLR